MFIYFTLDEIQEVLVCGHNKATRLLVELEKYALIERVRQGQGKPAKIYIKNFIVPESNEPETPVESDIKTSEKPTSALPGFSPFDCPKGVGIYTDKNDGEFSYIDLSIQRNNDQLLPKSGKHGQTFNKYHLAHKTLCTPNKPRRSHTAPLAALYEQVCHLVAQMTLVGGKAPHPLSRK